MFVMTGIGNDNSSDDDDVAKLKTILLSLKTIMSIAWTIWRRYKIFIVIVS